VVYTDFEDELGETTTIDLPQVTAGLNMSKFREKARQFLKEHESHLSLQRLRRNQPLTASRSGRTGTDAGRGRWHQGPDR
jgi:type I restriction enzyme R subunit